MKNPRDVIRKLLDTSLSNARDAIARAEQQLRRMPFDHDTRDALERYKDWEYETEIAITWLEEKI